MVCPSLRFPPPRSVSYILSLVAGQDTCLAPKVPVTLVRTYGTVAREEKLYVYEGTSATGTLLDTLDGNNMAGQIVTKTYCLNSALHTLRGIDGYAPFPSLIP